MNEPSPTNDTPPPAPEALRVPSSGEDTGDTPVDARDKVTTTPITERKRRISYRPSHKATFIGLAVVGLVLTVNAVILYAVMKNRAAQAESEAANSVTISSEELSKLGVSRNAVGNAATELRVGPNSIFNGDVTVAKNMTIAGQLNLNSKFTATEASLTKLQAGETAVEQLNVNGDGTISTLNLRRDLQVAGAARVQGQLTVNQLTTINNNLNVAGNLSIGGALSVRAFQVGQMTVAGHLISSGGAPSTSVGGGAGSNGTATIGGNDTAGTIGVNTGVGAGNGTLATVKFNENFASTPRVIVSPVGRAIPGLYVSNRTSSGFTIAVDGALAPGGYMIDYIVMQ